MILTTPAMNNDTTSHINHRAQTLNTIPGDSTSTIRITQPGVYVLNADLIGEIGKVGIRIDADNVTLQLNGRSVLGCEGSLDGIVVSHLAANVTVREGTVSGWGQDGVDLSNAVGCRVSRVKIHGNQGVGMLLGENAKVEDCEIEHNRQSLMA